jgi:YD repeat-containing protein
MDYSYNAAGESTGWSWVNGQESGTVSLTRDSAGRISATSATTMGLSVDQALTYDTESRLSTLEQTIGNVTRTASATYENTGRLSTLTYPAGFAISYQYNGDGQVTAIKKGTTTLASYGYDSAGRLSTRTLANGATTQYQYNTMSRLVQITVTTPTGTLWAQRIQLKRHAVPDAAPTGQILLPPETQGGAGACPGLWDKAPLGLIKRLIFVAT